MEDLIVILTDLAEKKMEEYEDKELKELIYQCDYMAEDADECYEEYRISYKGLTASCLAFIDGLDFIGKSVDTEYLKEKVDSILSDFSDTFFDYMERFKQWTHSIFTKQS